MTPTAQLNESALSESLANDLVATAAAPSLGSASDETPHLHVPHPSEAMKELFFSRNLETLPPAPLPLSTCLADPSTDFATASKPIAPPAEAAAATSGDILATLRAEVLAAAGEAEPDEPHRDPVHASGQVPSHYDLRGHDSSGVVGLVGALVRSALDLAEKGLQAATPADARHAASARRWIFGPGFDLWVSHAGADPDTLRELLIDRLPWLAEPESNISRGSTLEGNAAPGTRNPSVNADG
jgi:hypothetical protein